MINRLFWGSDSSSSSSSSVAHLHLLQTKRKKQIFDETMSTMKNTPKADPDHIFYPSWRFSKLMAFFFLLISLSYLIYSLRFVSHSYDCDQNPNIPIIHSTLPVVPKEDHHNPSPPKRPFEEETNISHIVFGIGASAKLWKQRKEYIKLWWRPNQMRGIVWLEQKVKTEPDDEKLLPPLKISEDTSRFKYKNKKGHRSAIRISRIVSETVRLGMEGVRWFVMGDDDTVFVTENLVKVLQKYDHNQFYYIGSSSESHLQNIYFSYNMAYGGGGFAISYPLAVALEKMQDRCIQRYPGLYGSDDRIQACMAELGVPLTKEKGFHQFDVYGNLFGLLAAHPVTPLVSLHHLDVVEPIFPNVSRVQALKRLAKPIKLDPAGLMQQSICYDKTRTWTVSMSWGYAVQIYRGIFSAREMEMPARTFLNWYKRADYTAYPFNTRPVSRNICQKPFVYYLSNAIYMKAVLEPAMQGHDMIGRARTGTGKTLAFGIPILDKIIQFNAKHGRGRHPLALVLAPTRELARQVEKEFKEAAPNMETICLYGGMPISQQMRQLDYGVDVAVGTPGRIIDLLNRGSLKLKDVQFVVLDEADQMLQVGFQEEVEKILEKLPSNRQTLMFSATMPAWIKNITRNYLNNPLIIDLVGDSDQKLADGISLYSVASNAYAKAGILAPLITEHAKGGKCIVFTQTKRDADRLSYAMAKSLKCEALHGDISQTQRERTLAGFRNNHFNVLVATDVASRGLDIPNVDLVIHYDLPNSSEIFVHRSGRTGRAGKKGTAILVYTDDQSRAVKTIERDVGCRFTELPKIAVESGSADMFGGMNDGRFRPSGGMRDRRSGGSPGFSRSGSYGNPGFARNSYGNSGEMGRFGGSSRSGGPGSSQSGGFGGISGNSSGEMGKYGGPPSSGRYGSSGGLFSGQPGGKSSPGSFGGFGSSDRYSGFGDFGSGQSGAFGDKKYSSQSFGDSRGGGFGAFGDNQPK